MSDELKIDIQVDANTEPAETKVDNLIEEFKKKKPIDLDVRIGKTDFSQFKADIQDITKDLTVLSELKFSNLKTIETSLKNVAKAVKEYQGVMSLDSSSSDKSVLSGLAGFEDFEIAENNRETLKKVIYGTGDECYVLINYTALFSTQDNLKALSASEAKEESR